MTHIFHSSNYFNWYIAINHFHDPEYNRNVTSFETSTTSLIYDNQGVLTLTIQQMVYLILITESIDQWKISCYCSICERRMRIYRLAGPERKRAALRG